MSLPWTFGIHNKGFCYCSFLSFKYYSFFFQNKQRLDKEKLGPVNKIHVIILLNSLVVNLMHNNWVSQTLLAQCFVRLEILKAGIYQLNTRLSVI